MQRENEKCVLKKILFTIKVKFVELFSRAGFVDVATLTRLDTLSLVNGKARTLELFSISIMLV